MRPATAGVRIVVSAPLSRSRVTGAPLADTVTMGALRRVATVVSPSRTVPQGLGASATKTVPAPPDPVGECCISLSATPASDASAVAKVAPLSHRYMDNPLALL